MKIQEAHIKTAGTKKKQLQTANDFTNHPCVFFGKATPGSWPIEKYMVKETLEISREFFRLTPSNSRPY